MEDEGVGAHDRPPLYLFMLVFSFIIVTWKWLDPTILLLHP